MEESKALQLARQAGMEEAERLSFEFQAVKFKQTVEDQSNHDTWANVFKCELDKELVDLIKYTTMILNLLSYHLRMCPFADCYQRPIQTKSYNWNEYWFCCKCKNRLPMDAGDWKEYAA